MNIHGKLLDEQTVRLERLLPGPIELVWAYLTESEKRGKWLATGETEPRVGGKVELRFNHNNLSPEQDSEAPSTDCGDDTVHYGTVTKYEPSHTLAYTWAENTGGTSEVLFELETVGEQVRLTITHERLPDMETIVGVSSGWETHVAIMADCLSGNTPKPFWGVFNRLKTAYEELYAA